MKSNIGKKLFKFIKIMLVPIVILFLGSHLMTSKRSAHPHPNLSYEQVHYLTQLGTDGRHLENLMIERPEDGLTNSQILFVRMLLQSRIGDVLRLGESRETPCSCEVEVFLVAGYTNEFSNLTEAIIGDAPIYALNTGQGQHNDMSVVDLTAYVDEDTAIVIYRGEERIRFDNGRYQPYYATSSRLFIYHYDSFEVSLASFSNPMGRVDTDFIFDGFYSVPVWNSF